MKQLFLGYPDSYLFPSMSEGDYKTHTSLFYDYTQAPSLLSVLFDRSRPNCMKNWPEPGGE